jgi:hypothetical protein
MMPVVARQCLYAMPETVIFSKVQSRQRVAEVKAAVAMGRDLNELVNNQEKSAQKQEIIFHRRITKNL